MLRNITVLALLAVTAFACKGRNGGTSAVQSADEATPSQIPPQLTAAGIWTAVTSDPYASLPINDVSLWKFASSKINPSPDLLTARAVQTVGDDQNIISHFEKLVHANGTCVRGRWVIDRDSPYTGHFSNGTDAPFIGRISVAFGNIHRGDYRAFGFAGKIFYAGENTTDLRSYRTANFFTIDDLAGTLAPNVTEVELSNEPPLTKSNVLKQSPSIAAIAAATIVSFKLADKSPGMRQVYEISELGLSDGTQAVTPKWMHIKGVTKMKNGHPDFRQDLRMENFDGPMTFDIKVSSASQTDMETIGHIVIEEAVASDTCDHRLHFHHPKFRDDLVFQ